MTARPVCGFIGLGSQGAPMARRMLNATNKGASWETSFK